MKEIVEKSIFKLMPTLSTIGESEELFDKQLRIDSNIQMNELQHFENVLLTIMGSLVTILILFCGRLFVLFCTLFGNSSWACLIPCCSGRPREEIFFKIGSYHQNHSHGHDEVHNKHNQQDEKVTAQSHSDSAFIEVP